MSKHQVIESECHQYETALSQSMRLIATGAPLSEILETLVLNIEACNPSSICSILLLDSMGTHVLTGAAPHLPAFFNQAIHGLPIGPNVGSCGTAAYLNTRVVVDDIQNSPLWAHYKDLAAKAHVNSCWSEPIRDSVGRVIGTFAIYHRGAHIPSPKDIDIITYAAQIAAIAIERKRTEEALKELVEERSRLLKMEKEARSQAERANQMKDEFLATLSHELRTPLTTILSWIQLLRMGRLDPEKSKRGLAILEESAKAQGQLIDDLLDVSRIQAGKMKMETRVIDPKKVIAAAIESVRSIATSKDIKIEVDIDPAVKSIYADPYRLQQILWNLLTNSLKFSPPQRGKVSIQVNTHFDSTGKKIKIQVQDNGKGIRPDFLSVIFDRFSQADSSSTRSHGGLGLGLAIVHKLVELHEGTIQAESPGEGQGSTFTIYLPIKESESIDQPNQEAEPTLLNGISILLLEDEDNAREVLTFMLQTYGATVRSAQSVSQALELLIDYFPDIILSDIAMPGEDGYSFIYKVRAMNTRMCQIPAIALTAYAGEENVKRSLMAGFQAHLSKPVDANKLARTINQLIDRNELGRCNKILFS